MAQNIIVQVPFWNDSRSGFVFPKIILDVKFFQLLVDVYLGEKV